MVLLSLSASPTLMPWATPPDGEEANLGQHLLLLAALSIVAVGTGARVCGCGHGCARVWLWAQVRVCLAVGTGARVSGCRHRCARVCDGVRGGGHHCGL